MELKSQDARALEISLASHAIGGDASATEGLLAALWPLLHRTARGMLRDDQAAQDVAQEASAIRVLMRLARREQRRVRAREALAQLLGDSQILPSFVDGSVARLDLAEAVRTLPFKLRAPLSLKYASGLDSAEIAAALGIPRGTVRSRLSEGIRRLRILEEQPATLSSTASTRKVAL